MCTSVLFKDVLSKFNYTAPNNRMTVNYKYKSGAKIFGFTWTALPLKMGPICCAETWVTTHQSTQRNAPEERRSHLHRGASLKPRIFGCNWPELATENLHISHGSRCPGQDSNRAPMKYKSKRYCFNHLALYKVNYFHFFLLTTNESPY
jgi:hypothetical protein